MAGWKSLGMSAAIGACVATALTIRSSGEPRQFVGRMVNDSCFAVRARTRNCGHLYGQPASADEQAGDGQWARTSANRFRITFRLPEEKSDAISGGEYWAAGVLVLDELGQLRGPLEVELHNSTGRLVGRLRSIAKTDSILRWAKV